MTRRRLDDHLVAVRVRPSRRLAVLRTIAPALDRRHGYLARSVLAEEGDVEQLRRLAAGGWFVVRLRPSARRQLRVGHKVAGVLEARPVQRSLQGRLQIHAAELVVGAPTSKRVNRLSSTLVGMGMTGVRRLWRSGRFVVARCALGQDPGQQAEKLRAHPDVESAEIDYVEAAGSREGQPLLQLADQWQWENWGQSDGVFDGYPGADVGAAWAWRVTRGKGVVIGVLDTGFAPRNQAFSHAIHPGSAAFAEDGSIQLGLAAIVEDCHGAACSAIAAGRATPGASGHGIAPQALLHWTQLPGALRQSVVATAIVYSALPGQVVPWVARRKPWKGSDVISASFGPAEGAYPIAACVKDALTLVAATGRARLGAAFFWAVSHDAAGTPVAEDQLATHPAVLAVGQSSNRDEFHRHAMGPQLDMVAPGLRVQTTNVPTGERAANTGTSFAAPCAAGVAALVLSLRPRMRREQLEALLLASCRKIGSDPYLVMADGSFRNDRFGYGRIDAAIAVARALAT